MKTVIMLNAMWFGKLNERKWMKYIYKDGQIFQIKNVQDQFSINYYRGTSSQSGKQYFTDGHSRQE